MANTADSRVANASILGYEFQMLMSIQEFLKAYENNKKDVLTVEGQEDLDVHGSDSKLCQYKYYSGDISKSRIQEAVAYLFKFWQQHEGDGLRYRLFIHGKLNFDQNEDDFVFNILNLTRAQRILSGTERGKIDLNSNEVDRFSEFFDIENVGSYEEEKEETICSIKKVLGGSSLSSEFLIFPEAMQHIHDLAIREKLEDRKEVAEDFVNHLETARIINNHSIYRSVQDEKVQRQAFMAIMGDHFSYKKRDINYVLEFGEKWNSSDVVRIIRKLVPLFAYKDNRIVNKPLTFVLDVTKKEMLEIKELLFSEFASEDIHLTMNDGFENFGFEKTYFSRDPLVKLSSNGSKYKELAFNFRLVTSHTFVKEGIQISSMVVVGFDSSGLCDSLNSIRLDSFNSDFVITCIGGLSR